MEAVIIAAPTLYDSKSPGPQGCTGGQVSLPSRRFSAIPLVSSF